MMMSSPNAILAAATPAADALAAAIRPADFGAFLTKTPKAPWTATRFLTRAGALVAHAALFAALVYFEIGGGYAEQPVEEIPVEVIVEEPPAAEPPAAAQPAQPMQEAMPTPAQPAEPPASEPPPVAAPAPPPPEAAAPALPDEAALALQRREREKAKQREREKAEARAQERAEARAQERRREQAEAARQAHEEAAREKRVEARRKSLENARREQAARRAAAREGQSQARGSGAGARDMFDPNAYRAIVLARVSSVATRVCAGHKGRAVVALTIGSSGRISGASIARSSGDGGLDAAAVAAMRGVGGFPPPTGRPSVSIPVAVVCR
ncbi:MAG: TonB family protein [Hyphomicrobiales bacterium]|nr:TonB family protein [Hyphomicrobiales bacterium]